MEIRARSHMAVHLGAKLFVSYFCIESKYDITETVSFDVYAIGHRVAMLYIPECGGDVQASREL